MFFRKRPPLSDRLDLKLPVAAPGQWSNRDAASATRLLRALDDELESPQQLLQEALARAHDLNRLPLAAAKRLKITSELQRRLWPTLAATRDALRKNEDGVPEPQPQRELLDLVDQVIHALNASYQIAVQADYRVDERHGRAEQARMLEASMRVLELTHLRQRLRALRYQPLPPNAWRTINTLFCLLSRAGVADTPVPALCDDRLLVDNDGTTRPLRVYTLIQAFGLFDCFAWSKRRQRFLDSYCTAFPEALVVTYLPKTAVGGTVRFTHAHQGGPPRRSAEQGGSHRILIDCNALADAVRRDNDTGRRQLTQASSPTVNCLAGLPPLARRPILRAMLHSLEHGVPPHQPDQGERHRCEFHVETGFERVSQHLQTVFTSDPAERDQLLRNATLAGRFTTQGNDRAGTQWLVLQQTDQHTVVSTQETCYTEPIALGALATYGIGEEGFLRPTIGEVARILRLDDGQILIGITRRARFGTLVNVFATMGGDSTDTTAAQVPCLLAYEDDVGWCVISSPRHSLPVGCPIQIRTRELRVTTRLRRLRVITPHFMLFELDAMRPRLGTPSYPSARRRHRHSRIVVTGHLHGVTAEPTEEHHRPRRKLR